MHIGSSLHQPFSYPNAIPGQRIVALGLGAAGTDLLTHLMDAGLDGVYCMAADSDPYHLEIARAHSKLLMDDSACTDAGTGGNVNIGERIAHQAPELKDALNGAGLVFVLAGMGGGTGGGSSPVIAEYARKQGSTVVGLVTKPFPFDRNKTLVAIDSMRKMLNTCDTVILLDHQSFAGPSLTLPFGFGVDVAGETCCAIVSSIADVFAGSHDLNGDLAELRAMLKRGGLAKVGLGESYSMCGVEGALLDALRKTVPQGDLLDANGVLVDIAGREDASNGDIEVVLDLVLRRTNPNAQVLCSGRLEHSLHGLTKVTVLVTGLSFPYSWGGYRRLPLGIYELEPEAGADEEIKVELDLHQLEDFAAQRIL